MQDDVFNVRTLTIASTGLLIFLFGLGLYIFRDLVAKNVRFFLPIPPIGVAAYIFVFSTYTYYGGQLTGNMRPVIRELFAGTGMAAAAFFLLSAGNLAVCFLLKRLL